MQQAALLAQIPLGRLGEAKEVAEAVAVAVQRDQGQERYIQVRGAPNRWTSVSIDGVPMVGVDEGGDTRAFRFDAIPAVLLSDESTAMLDPAGRADILRLLHEVAADGVAVVHATHLDDEIDAADLVVDLGAVRP